jgi:hypothetical protein
VRDEIAQEIQRQLAEGNGGESESTRGMTLRELVLELRADNREKPSRKEVYTVVSVISALALGFARAVI